METWERRCHGLSHIQSGYCFVVGQKNLLGEVLIRCRNALSSRFNLSSPSSSLMGGSCCWLIISHGNFPSDSQLLEGFPRIHPSKLTRHTPQKWRFGSDDFPDFNWLTFRFLSPLIANWGDSIAPTTY